MKPERVQPPLVYYLGGLGPAPKVHLRDAALALGFDGGSKRIRRPPTQEDARDLLAQPRCFCVAYPEAEAAESLRLVDGELDSIAHARVTHGGETYVLADPITIAAAHSVRIERLKRERAKASKKAKATGGRKEV
ncbi:MAG: hypothetical protein AAGN66_08570 [Acidobacteriota bacterium]